MIIFKCLHRVTPKTLYKNVEEHLDNKQDLEKIQEI